MGVENPPPKHHHWPCEGYSTPLSLKFLIYETRLQIEQNPEVFFVGLLVCFGVLNEMSCVQLFGWQAVTVPELQAIIVIILLFILGSCLINIWTGMEVSEISMSLAKKNDSETDRWWGWAF